MTGKQSHSHFHHGTRTARAWPGLVAALLALMLLAACDRPRGLQMIKETDEPHYRRGEQALRGNQKQIALEAFQKVIDKRQGDAPESHLEVGRIYLEHLKEPIKAYYYFDRYLELTGPNGLLRSQVEQLRATALREFILKEAGALGSTRLDQLDLQDENEKLRAEVTSLRAEVERLSHSGRSGVATNVNPPPASGNNRTNPPPVGGGNPTTTNNTVRTNQTTTGPLADTGPVGDVVPIVADPPVDPVRPPPADSGRTYTVQQGDTLVAISRKIFGTPSRWKAIYEVNRDRIPDPNALKIGTELRLP